MDQETGGQPEDERRSAAPGRGAGRGDRPRPGGTRPTEPAEGVRIIGADEAAEAIERGDVVRRRGDDMPRFGDRPAPPPEGPRPTLRFPLSGTTDPTAVERPPIVPPPAPAPPAGPVGPAGARGGPPPEPPAGRPRPEPVPEPAVRWEDDLTPGAPLPDDDEDNPFVARPITGSTPLPHWTEPPTGEVPAVLADRGGDDDDLAAWSSFATAGGPRWRDQPDDWDDGDFDPTRLADDEVRLGALDPDRPSTADLYDFDEPVARQPRFREPPAAEEPRPLREARPRRGARRRPGTGAGADGGAPGRHQPVADPYASPVGPAPVADPYAAPPGPAPVGDPYVAAAAADPYAGGADPYVGGADPYVGGADPYAGVDPTTLTGPDAAGAPGVTFDPGDVEPGAPSGQPGRGRRPAAADRRARAAAAATGGQGGATAVGGGGPRSAAGAARGAAGTRGRGDRRPPTARRGGPGGPGGPGRTGQGAGRDVPVAVGVGLLFAAVALVLFKVGSAATMVLVTAVLVVAAVEFFTASRQGGHQPAVLLGIAATGAMALAAYWRGEAAYPLVLFLTVVFGLLWHLVGAGEERPVPNLGVTLLGVAYVGGLGSFAALLLKFPNGVGMLLGAVIATVAYDVGGYAVGRNAGRTPLAPSVSPNKTWEGLIGGILLTVAATTVIVGELPGIHPFDDLGDALKLGIVAAVAAPLGDLCESLLKRDMGVKDMGSILPAHGGLLDRFDALLFVLPATYYLVRLLDLA